MICSPRGATVSARNTARTTPVRRRRITHKRLRILANHLARLFAELGIVEFDVECQLVPRRRPEYASVETRTKNAKGRSGEDVIPVPVLRHRSAKK